MTRILLVEDAEESRVLVERALAGLEITAVQTLTQASDALRGGRFDLAVLDIQLPDGDGLKFYSMLTSAPEGSIPTIIVSARDDIANKVTAFALGVEDFVAKPFDPQELRARVFAKLKRLDQDRHRESSLRFGALEVDLESQAVRAKHPDGITRTLDLTSKEFRLLTFLIRRKGRVCSREALLDEVWGRGLNVVDRTVDSHVSHLRKKLEGAVLIEAVTGEGYRLSEASPVSAL